MYVAEVLLPPRERLGVREVDRRAPLVDEDAGERREEAVRVGVRCSVRAPDLIVWSRLDVRRVPERDAQAGVVQCLDHRASAPGNFAGVEVERVHARSRTGDRSRCRSSRDRACGSARCRRATCAWSSVLVAPDQRAERPRRGQARVAGDVVVVLVTSSGSSAPNRWTRRPSALDSAGAERDLERASARVWRDVEDARPADSTNRPQPRVPMSERDRDVVLVVGGSRRGVDLDLHRAELAAVLDAVDPLAEPVEALALVDGRARDAETRCARRDVRNVSAKPPRSTA